VHTPFLQSDIGCTDIANTIGIVGTPTIDPATDIAYFFSKTYIPNYRAAGNTGTYNGVYYFHGVNINTLQDVAGFLSLLMDLLATMLPQSTSSAVPFATTIPSTDR
jgi:iron transport multicopper oxidase